MFIVVAPSLTTHPSNLTIDEDDEATFRCVATGNPTPKITWINNGRTVTTGETLSFKANRTNSGKYSCLADNGFDVTVNTSAYLNVLCKCGNIISVVWRISPNQELVLLHAFLQWWTKVLGTLVKCAEFSVFYN